MQNATRATHAVSEIDLLDAAHCTRAERDGVQVVALNQRSMGVSPVGEMNQFADHLRTFANNLAVRMAKKNWKTSLI